MKQRWGAHTCLQTKCTTTESRLSASCGADQLMLARSEQTIAGIAQTWQDVAVRVQLAVESGADNRYVGVCLVYPRHARWGRYQAEKTDALCTGALERGDGSDRAPARGEHRIEEEELTFRGVGGNLEVVVHRLEGIVVTVEPDMPNACRRDQPQNAVDHAKSRAEDRHEGELFSGKALTLGGLERGLHGDLLQREIRRGLVRHEHGDLVHELLKDLFRGVFVAEERHLVAYEWVLHHGEEGGAASRRRCCHAADTTILPFMKEYQAVILRLTGRTREDEDALTDLLNERSRGGWDPTMMTPDPYRLTIIFARASQPER